MTEVYLISGALLMSAALVAAFRYSVAGTVCAYAGVWALRASGYSPLPSSLLLFWAIAVLLVISIGMARTTAVDAPGRLRYFIVGGAMAGMAAGLCLYQAGAIIGSATGAVLGAFAFSRIYPSGGFRHTARATAAIGLPAVVTMALVALGIQGILARATGF